MTAVASPIGPAGGMPDPAPGGPPRPASSSAAAGVVAAVVPPLVVVAPTVGGGVSVGPAAPANPHPAVPDTGRGSEPQAPIRGHTSTSAAKDKSER